MDSGTFREDFFLHKSVHESATGIIKQVMFGARPRGRRGERGEPSPLPTSCQSCVSFVLPGREPVVRRHPRERHSVPLGSGSWRTDALRQPGGSIGPSVRPSRGKGPYLPGCPARDEGERGGAGAGALGLPSFLSSSWGHFRNFKNILFYRAMQFIRITNSRIMD